MHTNADPFAEPRRRRGGLWFFLGLAAVLLVVYTVVAVALAWSDSGTTGRRRLGALGSDRIAVIGVNGVITAGGQGSLLSGGGGAGAGTIVRQLHRALRDPGVKAIILRINSPGGSAAASQEVFEEVLAARQKKPCVASMADTAASGGYYIASACNRIVANRATATGSIGVIMSGMNYSGLLQRYAIKDQTITSGKFKAIGSATRPLSPEGRALLQGLVDNTYQQFLGDVARGRGRPASEIAKVADGRVLTGEQAQAVGLVDVLGGFYEAVRVAQKLAKLKPKGEPNLQRYDRSSWLEDLLESRAASQPPRAQVPLANLAPSPDDGASLLWFLAPVTAPSLLPN